MISTQKHQDQVAPIMAQDEPDSSWSNVVIGIFASTIIMLMIALGTYYSISKQSSKLISNSNKTVIHDTIIVHDTIRIDHSPITYVCQGICDGVAGFENR